MATELDENRGEEGTGVLFSGVLEIEEEIGYVCGPDFGNAFDILDDRRASSRYYKHSGRNESYRVTHVRTLLPEPATDPEVVIEEQRCKEQKDVRFPYIHSKDPDFFQSLKMLPSVNHSAEAL